MSFSDNLRLVGVDVSGGLWMVDEQDMQLTTPVCQNTFLVDIYHINAYGVWLDLAQHPLCYSLRWGSIWRRGSQPVSSVVSAVAGGVSFASS
jgi:hypothetical protein